MIVSLIVAADEAGGIGYEGRLPWRLPDDLKRFKQLTMGHHLIVGRKTWEAIGRPLPGRIMLVVTRNQEYHPEGCRVVPSVPQALSKARQHGERQVFVGGGGQIYEEAIPWAERIYLTRVHATFPADTVFPELDMRRWRIVAQEDHPGDEKNPIPFTWQILEGLPIAGLQEK